MAPWLPLNAAGPCGVGRGSFPQRRVRRMDNGRLVSTWWTLKIAVGLVFVLEGVDKFFGFLANWTDLINPAVLGSVPVPPEQLVMAAGILEVLLGIAILTRWTK